MIEREEKGEKKIMDLPFLFGSAPDTIGVYSGPRHILQKEAFPKFGGNPFTSFCVILLTNHQGNRSR